MKKRKKIIITAVSLVLAVAIIGGSVTGLLLCYEKKEVPVVKKDFPWNDNGDTEIIRKRIAEELNDKELDVTDIMADFDFNDGSFKSIDYESSKKDTWHAAQHLDNLKSLQIACHTPGNKFYESSQVKQAVLKGVNYWAEKNFYCDWNGWWNDIGIGLRLPDILIYGVEGLSSAVEEKLTDSVMKNDLENSTVFAAVKEREVNPSGGNLTDNVLSSLKLAVIKNDGSKIMWLRSLLERELKPVPTYKWTMHRHDADGIKEDMSNLQHWHLLYFGGYGEVFVTGINRYIKYTEGTQYALTDESLNDYANYILDGQQFAFRNEYREWNASGRGVVMEGSLKGIRSGIEDALRLLLKHDKLTRYNEIKEVYERRFGEKDGGAGGHRFYYESDYQIMNNEKYMAAVRHASNRTRIFEFLNDENPMGHYTGFGGTFYYVNGDEYFDLPPVYDWNKIPGTTVRQGFLPMPDEIKSYNQKGNTKYTAGVSNGKIGSSYISLKKYGVSSNQAYFMFEDGVVCLGNNISSSKKEEIVTTVNQTKAGSQILLGRDGKRTVLSPLQRVTGKYDYVYNNSISYITSAELSVIYEPRKKGDWKTVSTRKDSKAVTGDLFTAYISYGAKPKKAKYDYTVLMNTTPEKTEDYLKSPTLITIQNEKNVQAVYDSKHDVMQAVFYSEGTLNPTDSMVLTVDSGCLCILEKDNGKYILTVSSRDFGEHDITVNVNGTSKKIAISKKPVTVEF